MRELETHLKIGNNSETRTELNVKKQQEIEYILEGTIKPKKGNVVWELNEVTGEIKKAEYKRDTVGLFVAPPPEKLITHPDCVYIPAFNKTAARNQYLKNPNQQHYFYKEPPLKLNDITF